MNQRSKPRKHSLISNLLKRVDGTSLSIKKSPSGGIIYFLESDKVKHLKANKESLIILEYVELEMLLNFETVTRANYTLEMFKLEMSVPEKLTETIHSKGSVLVKSIKEIDKIGSDKFNDDKAGRLTKPTIQKTKRKRL